MAKRAHHDFRSIKASTYDGLANPGAPHRVDQRVAGNPSVFAEALEPSVSAPKARKRGGRVKHHMKKNWLKMYDKFGLILRI